MVADAYVNHVPVMTGGRGKKELRAFYSTDFIPKMPADTKLTPVSRTIGQHQLVDEIIFSFTHTEEMPWMLPGVAPTNKHVEIPLGVIVKFRDGKLAHEHIYWDQASVLKQIGLITDPQLLVFGAERHGKSCRANERRPVVDILEALKKSIAMAQKPAVSETQGIQKAPESVAEIKGKRPAWRDRQRPYSPFLRSGVILVIAMRWCTVTVTGWRGKAAQRGLQSGESV